MRSPSIATAPPEVVREAGLETRAQARCGDPVRTALVVDPGTSGVHRGVVVGRDADDGNIAVERDGPAGVITLVPISSGPGRARIPLIAASLIQPHVAGAVTTDRLPIGPDPRSRTLQLNRDPNALIELQRERLEGRLQIPRIVALVVQVDVRRASTPASGGRRPKSACRGTEAR